MLIAGCSTQRDLQTPQKPKINPDLPIIDNQKVRMLPDIKSIALEWQGTSIKDARGYHIYRSDLQKEGEELKRIASIEEKYAKHYVDTNLNPATHYIYAISVIGPDGTESRPSKAKGVKTLPVLDSVSFIHATSELPRKVRIEWRPHESYAVEKYVVERNTAKTSEWKKIATVDNRLSAEYIDTDLRDNEKYTYRVRSITYNGITSKPSQSVSAVTKALPTSVSELMATKDQPRKIALAWVHSTQDDVVNYRIYYSSSADGSYSKLQTIPATANRIEHLINEDNKRFFYKVTTIDKDGLEADLKLLPAVEGLTLPAPMQPTITLALIKDNTVILNWASGDSRAVTYNIYKTQENGMFDNKTQVIKDVKDVRFEDTDVTRGVTYEYQIQAVDKYNLVSAKTPKASLSIPKLKDNK
jgi:fibronectin type 3 domain-containing protein